MIVDVMRIKRYVFCGVVVSFLFFFSTAVSSNTLDNALNLYQQGNFQSSHNALVKLARDDNPQAFFLLGKMYERGDGVERSEVTAIDFYQRASLLGSEAAEQRLTQLQNGENSVVLDWYLESAWDGDVESEFNLGYLYETGMGVKIDETLALQWYEEAANQQHADAQLRLGMMLIVGAGIESDVGSGLRWINKASSNSNQVAKIIDKLLVKNNDHVNLVQIIRGLRTLEHSDADYMLSVLHKSINQAIQTQPKHTIATLEKLAPNPELFGEAAGRGIESNWVRPSGKNIHVSDSVERQSDGELAIVEKAAESKNLTMWLTGLAVLVAFVYVLIKMVLNKQILRLPKLKKRQALELPELSMAAKAFAFEVNQQSQSAVTEFSLPEAAKNVKQPNVYELHEAHILNDAKPGEEKLNVVIAQTETAKPAITQSELMQKSAVSTYGNTDQHRFSSENFDVKNISKSSLLAPKIENRIKSLGIANSEKISSDSFLPAFAGDLQFSRVKPPKVKPEPAAYLQEMKRSLAKAKQAASRISEQSKIQQQKIKTMLDEDVSNNYIKAQSLEYEASRNNDVDAVSQARLNIAIMFLEGNGVAKNIQLAIKWLEKASGKGNKVADDMLAQVYLDYPEFVDSKDESMEDVFEQQFYADQAS